jgi:hypothetical protein
MEVVRIKPTAQTRRIFREAKAKAQGQNAQGGHLETLQMRLSGSGL